MLRIASLLALLSLATVDAGLLSRPRSIRQLQASPSGLAAGPVPSQHLAMVIPGDALMGGPAILVDGSLK